jgi:hypothetical protein
MARKVLQVLMRVHDGLSWNVAPSGQNVAVFESSSHLGGHSIVLKLSPVLFLRGFIKYKVNTIFLEF